MNKNIDNTKVRMYNELVQKKLNRKEKKKMEANIEEIKQLIQEEYRGNQTWFAEEIGINGSYMNEIINKRKSAKSNKLCLAIIKWCEAKKRDYKRYIFFTV